MSNYTILETFSNLGKNYIYYLNHFTDYLLVYSNILKETYEGLCLVFPAYYRIKSRLQSLEHKCFYITQYEFLHVPSSWSSFLKTNSGYIMMLCTASWITCHMLGLCNSHIILHITCMIMQKHILPHIRHEMVAFPEATN